MMMIHDPKHYYIKTVLRIGENSLYMQKQKQDLSPSNLIGLVMCYKSFPKTSLCVFVISLDNLCTFVDTKRYKIELQSEALPIENCNKSGKNMDQY